MPGKRGCVVGEYGRRGKELRQALVVDRFDPDGVVMRMLKCRVRLAEVHEIAAFAVQAVAIPKGWRD